MATLSNKMSHTKLSLRWFLAAGAAIVALGLPQYSRGADQVEVKGDCNAVAQDERVDKASVKIVNIYCNKGNGLGINSFRVRYIWIDALDASFLLAGYSDEVLVKTIGNSPRVLKNLVYDEMAEIINSFGDRPQTIDHTTTVKSGKDELSSFSSALIPSAVLRKIKVYAATDPLPWPDLEASLHIRDDESTWPDN